MLQLNVEACDDNTPKKCDTAVASISVLRQQLPPVFADTPYRVSIDELRPVDSVITRVRAVDEDLVSDAPDVRYSIGECLFVSRFARELSSCGCTGWPHRVRHERRRSSSELLQRRAIGRGAGAAGPHHRQSTRLHGECLTTDRALVYTVSTSPPTEHSSTQ